MSLTTQSASLPVVEATRLTVGSPLILSGSVNGPVTKVSTSLRPEASRSSSTRRTVRFSHRHTSSLL